MKHFSKFTRFAITTLFILSLSLQGIQPAAAQDESVRIQHHAQTGKVSFIGAAPGKTISVRAAQAPGLAPQDRALAMIQPYAADLGLKQADQELTLAKSETAKDRQITKFQQVYQGIPVMAGELVVNATKQGELLSINGEIAPDLELDTKPTITADQAQQTALQSIAKWRKGNAADFETSQPALWIYDSRLLEPDGQPAALVWRMDVSGKDATSAVRELVLVDAHRGNIPLHFNQVDTAWSIQPASARIEEPSPQALAAVDLNATEASREIAPVPTNTLAETAPSVEEAVPNGALQTLTGTTRYVTTTGADSGTCSASTSPCHTVNYAIGQSAAGDLIKLSSGTYTGSAGAFSTNKSLTISGGWAADFSSLTGYSTISVPANQTGIYIYNGPNVTINNLIVQDATNHYSGGGIRVDTSTLTLNHSSIRNNNALWGGGIYSYNAMVNLNDVTVRGNTATLYNARGAGIDVDGGQLNINNSTIVDNVGLIGGGLYYANTTTITIRNSILANNSASGGSGIDCYQNPVTYGGITVLDHSLVENSADCSLPAGSGNILDTDPGIMPYVSTGGYYTLAGPNLALDTGNPATCLADDQRGVARPQGAGCDMGAYEAALSAGAPASIILLGGSNQHSLAPYAFPLPLAVYILDADSNPVAGASVTFSAPASGASGTFQGSGTNATTLLTGAGGVVRSSIFSPNQTTGSYAVIASSNGLSVAFELANRAFYVAPTGNDANACTDLALPCQTINTALGKADGDYVFVAAGTYTSSSTDPVVLIQTDVIISGGWNNTFTAQTGRTLVDGQNARRGIQVIYGVTASIQAFTVQNGYADYGAGIHSAGHLTIRDVAVANGRATGEGGGIYEVGGVLSVTNATISNNVAQLGGGGILIQQGSLILNNVTVTQNFAADPNEPAQGGGLLNTLNNSVTMTNTIVAGNAATNGPDCQGAIASGGYNLIGFNDGNCKIVVAGGDKVGIPGSPLNALLGNLMDNGGSTLTHALLTGSPAIDAGNAATCADTDQRGVSRPQGVACDIGAFEGSASQTVTPVARTYTSHHTTDLPGNFLCDQTQPNCTGGGDVHADKAQSYALQVYGFYHTHFDRHSIDDNNMPLISSVHYQEGATLYANAFWNGSQMVYGDAYGYPLADDVVGHELTHGVTQYESNLFYYYQSGAINESLSDVFGELFDQSNGQGTDTPAVKWLIGEDVSGLGALRSMSNPPAFGDPDKMSSPYYDFDLNELDNGGVHTNSGINNKAAYLMVDGGTFNGKTVTALGPDKTVAIYYEVNTHLLTSGSDYNDLYYDLYQACLNLVGGSAGVTLTDCQSVLNADDAVQMTAQPVANYNPDAPTCAANLMPIDVFHDGFENGMGNWVFPPARWQLDSPYGLFAHSGLHSAYADDYPDQIDDVANTMRSGVMLPPNAYLRFSHAYEFEHYNGDPLWYDGGVLEYTINDGATWNDSRLLIDYDGYRGTIASGYGNPLAGRQGFVGTSHGYISTRLNLSSLAGQTVKFRWRMGLDEVGYSGGWWLDDVSIYTCQAGYVISGNTGMAGVNLGYVNGSPKTAISLADGSYSLAVPAHWSGTVTPSKPGYAFSPASRSYSNLMASQAGQNYQHLPIISGNVGAAGVTLSYMDGTPKTVTSLADGSYSLSVPFNWGGTVTPSHACYTFSPLNRTFTNVVGDQTAQDYAPAFNVVSSCADTDVRVAGASQGTYVLPVAGSTRISYAGANNGPVQIDSTYGAPILAAERVLYKVNGVNTSFSEMMALPNSSLDQSYWLPWYNDVDLDTQLRFGNVSAFPVLVHVFIGGVEMTGSPFALGVGASTRVSFAGVSNGPVQITSDHNIVAAERVLYKINNVNTSFSEMMALPNSGLDTSYWLPWYNDVDLDTQLRFGNVSSDPVLVHVFIGGVEMTGSPFALGVGASTRVSFAGVSNGPVQITSDHNLVASERVLYKVNNVNTSFSEMMALPNSSLDMSYWLPWYNDVDLDTQLRFGNVSAFPVLVHVFIGGVEMAGSPFPLGIGASTRVSFAGVSNGPVQITSNHNIVAAERVLYKVNGVNTSFSEMMALPNASLDTSYWLPWYNNVDLDTQLRFGVP